MTTSRQHRVAIEAQGLSIEYKELKWLLDQLDGVPASHPIRVRVEGGRDQRDPRVITITSDVPDGLPHKVVAHYPPGVRGSSAKAD